VVLPYGKKQMKILKENGSCSKPAYSLPTCIMSVSGCLEKKGLMFRRVILTVSSLEITKKSEKSIPSAYWVKGLG